MSEDSIKTAEEQLHALINESNLVLTKMKGESTLIFSKLRKLINVLITVGAGIFITFLFSFVDTRSRIATLESEKVTTVEMNSKLESYASKSSVIFLQNDVYDMNKMFFSYRPNVEEQKMELTYTSALKQFNGDVSRGTEKIINK